MKCVRLVVLLVFGSMIAGSMIACRREPEMERSISLPAGVRSQDRSFHSLALRRDVTYRMILPASILPGQRLHVLYLLHGNGSGFREWSTYSPVAELAARGYVLVMPEGHSTYFMNAVGRPADRYEDYLTGELIQDAEKVLPVAAGRGERAIAGVSMGGFAAVTIALKHPELYGFAGAISPPIDAPERRFTFRRLSQSMGFRTIFGPDGSASRQASDPFVLARAVDARGAPYIFLSVGEQESLAEPVQRFDGLLTRHRFAHEFHMLPGGHDWTQWNRQLPAMEAALAAREP